MIQIKSGVEAFEQRKNEFQELAASSAHLTEITDSKSYGEVTKAIASLRESRVALTKEAKGLRDLIRPVTQLILDKEKELIAIIEPEEERLKEIKQKIDEEKERIKAQKEEAERQRIKAMGQTLLDAGCAFDGFNYSIGEIKIALDMLPKIDADTFENIMVGVNSAAEAIRIQKQMEEERKQKIEGRKSLLYNAGLSFNGNFVFRNIITLNPALIEEANDQKFYDLLDECEGQIRFILNKEEEEKEALRKQKEENERKEKEIKEREAELARQEQERIAKAKAEAEAKAAEEAEERRKLKEARRVSRARRLISLGWSYDGQEFSYGNFRTKFGESFTEVMEDAFEDLVMQMAEQIKALKAAEEEARKQALEEAKAEAARQEEERKQKMSDGQIINEYVTTKLDPVIGELKYIIEKVNTADTALHLAEAINGLEKLKEYLQNI